MQMIDDNADILLKLRNADSEGMDMLFRHYFRPLVFFADQFLHNISVSEDVVQEQMVKFWEKKAYRTVHPKALSTFLFNMVRNACLNHLEKKGLKLEELSLLHVETAMQESEAVDDARLDAVRKAFEGLPERTKTIVFQVMCEDHSYAETADILGISINTVKTSLRKGMHTLRQQLGVEGLVLFLVTHKKY